MTDFETRDEVLAVPESETFRVMLSGYFQVKVAERGCAPFKRRPRMAARLPHGDYVFSVRPSWDRRSLDCEIVTVEAIFQQDIRAMVLTLDRKGPHISMLSCRYVDDAIINFLELARFFPLMPWTCFARSTDRCCICGRVLTDPVSRARGVGPEC
ncbi:MAG: hypothetical protein KDA74_03935, partial [Planctomycetaceae bacterium]|nr:hypothetical protein [Planctomycetaceae bacterium]